MTETSEKNPIEENLSAQDLKNLGEKTALQGDSAAALSYLEKAVIEAVKEGNDKELLNTIAHIAIVYKHQFHTLDPKDPMRVPFIELMGAHALAGIRIAEEKKIFGQPKSAVQFRYGDYFYAKGDYSQAADEYNKALSELEQYEGEDKEKIQAEYLGHYGQALGMNGNTEGLTVMHKALESIQNSSESKERPFEKMIIASGLLMRIAEVSLNMQDTPSALDALTKAQEMAIALNDSYNIPNRFKQIQTIKEVTGLEF
jgi:tetratricopeptide (TPR) repeat protein